jgi:cell division septation protein DedD
MNNKLFNRVVIAVVIIALAVIFVPMLFSSRTTSLHSGLKKIPPMPSLPKVVQQKVPAQQMQTSTDQQVKDSAQPAPLTQHNQQAAKKSLSAAPKKVAKQDVQKPAADLSSINGPNIAHDEMDDAAARLQAAQVKDQAWLVRLTGFPNATAVSNEVQKLQQMGMPAYAYQQGKSNLSVNIGPLTNKTEAEKDLSTIKKTLKLNGEVIEFNPTELN